jgi:hypothetical protein
LNQRLFLSDFIFGLYSLGWLLASLFLGGSLPFNLVPQIQVEQDFWLLLAGLQQVVLHLLQAIFLFLIEQLQLLFRPIFQIFLKVFIFLSNSPFLHIPLDLSLVDVSLVLKDSLLRLLIGLLVLDL